ncbi:MAG: sulfurtransferase [Burkholderiales bacterium]|nr:sulfurtransferase [Burkholderiales bacterium]
MKQLSPPELREWLNDTTRAKPVLLDVREGWETEYCRIDGSNWIPMREVSERWDELNQEAETVVICHHGVRSYHVAKFLEHQGFSDVYNLSGGVDGWARQVDPTMKTY